MKGDGLILTALTKQIPAVLMPRARPQPSGAGHFLWLWQKPAQSLLLPKGLHSGNCSLLLNLLLCFGPGLWIRNDKSAPFKLQCQHDRALVATRGKRGRRELCSWCWASRNRIPLPALSHRIFNLLQAGWVAVAALAAVGCKSNSLRLSWQHKKKIKNEVTSLGMVLRLW